MRAFCLRFILAALLVVLGTGCVPLLRAAPAALNVNPLRPYTFDFAPGTTSDERAAFEAAYPSWNEVTKTSHRMRSVESDGNWHVFFVDRLFDSERGIELDGRECTRVGRDCPVAHSISIKRGHDAARTAVIARHEQGHALQLRHTPEGFTDAVMYPYVTTTSTQLTFADLAECRVAGACP